MLYLDEIVELPNPAQDKLVGFLRDGEYISLKSGKKKKINTWFITSAIGDPEQFVKDGKFRSELYDLLVDIKIFIPPLRDRPEDILPIIDYYLEQYAGQLDAGKLSKPGNNMKKKLMAYQWPSNVRDIQRLVKRFFVTGNWEKGFEELVTDKGNQ